MRRFEGRVAFVTGGANGIGRGIATRLAAEGAAVVLGDIETEAAAEAAEHLSHASGSEALAARCDVTDRGSVDAAIGLTVERFGRLDVLVNNAGGAVITQAFEVADIADWHRQLDLTLIGSVHCIQAALPHLLASYDGRPAGGNVVSIGSVNGLAAFGDAPYSAAKAGLQSLTQNLAATYGPQGVRFNLVAPGTVRTRNWDHQPGALERIAELVPLGRVGEPEDIAGAVAFLASDDAAWVTGTVLTVDGGVLSGPLARGR